MGVGVFREGGESNGGPLSDKLRVRVERKTNKVREEGDEFTEK